MKIGLAIETPTQNSYSVYLELIDISEPDRIRMKLKKTKDFQVNFNDKDKVQSLIDFLQGNKDKKIT